METGWCNRLTGLPCQNPEAIPLLGLWHSKGGTTWPGTQQDLEQPASASEPTETFHQSLSSLAASIRRLSDDRAMRHGYAELAYARARERFTTKRMIDDYLQLFRSLVSARTLAA